MIQALGLSHHSASELETEWWLNARAEQLPPNSGWFCWMILAGRGFGKTRTGSEWVSALVNKEQWAWGEGVSIPDEPIRVALLADNAEDAVKVMIKGRSGLLNTGPRHKRPRFKPSEKALYWPNGGMAFYYSAEDAEQLRGPEHHAAWVDELAKFRNPVDPWDNLIFGLRLGDLPRVLVTTTPRPHPMLKELVSQADTHTTRGSTYDNQSNLPKKILDKLASLYEGTRVGRQELYAELFDDVEGALFSTRMFDDCRLRQVPENVSLQRIVVAVDPPATGNENSNLCGIVVMGLGDDNHGYVLADETIGGAPDVWARAVVLAYHGWRADRIVGEVNNGGDMIEAVIRHVDAGVSYTAVHATRGKVRRAEPVSALYEQSRVHHVGPASAYSKMEGQLLMFAPGEKLEGPSSPDRADALVWAATELFGLSEVGNLLIIR
jgi:phage terminase large subunit-like protein